MYNIKQYSVKHFNCQFHRVLIKLHILISLLFTWIKTSKYQCVNLFIRPHVLCESVKKTKSLTAMLQRNSRQIRQGVKKKKEIEEITISLIMFEQRLCPSWIFAMNSKLNQSSLYSLLATRYVNCLNYLLFFAEPHWWTILKLCYWGLKK